MNAASILPNRESLRQTPTFRRRAGRGKLLPMWNLTDLVEHYTDLTKEFGKPLPLSSFRLSDAELICLFRSFDEDYHISRYLHFSNLSGKSYRIGVEDATHLSIDASIKEIL